MSKAKYISVLGCGWLGFPLAKSFLEDGYFVRGATTSPGKLDQLEAVGIDPFLVQFSPALNADADLHFFNSDILILTTPPKKQPEFFLQQMQEIQKLIAEHKPAHVLFISSTTVYAEENKALTEADAPLNDNPTALALQKAESSILQQNLGDNSIIRFGGLIGPGRDPGRFLAGKTNIPNGKAPVNLIHLDDCIGIIKTIIEKEAWGKVFNACAPHHPTRQEFYQLAAAKGNYAIPEFKDELLNWKKISNVNVPQLLDYQYEVSNWFNWLKH